MFEKEAEEYAIVSWDKCSDSRFAFIPRIDEIKLNDWKNGAEFGYNKANEWHYPSNGEYPNECEDVWCYCKGIGIKFCCVGHTIVGGDNKVRWWANNKTEELRVIAWKEITPPKEIE